MVAFLDIVDLSPIFIDYELTSGDFSYATYMHVTLYAIGSFFGYFCLRPSAIRLGDKLIAAARFCRLPNYKWFYFSSSLSIFLSLLYLYLVGVDIALLNAGPARGGDFFGLIGFEQYSFMKTIAMIGLFSVTSLPFIILTNKRLTSSAFIVLILEVSLYMLSVARVIFIETIFLFALLYYSLGRRNGKSTVILFLSLILLLFVAMFGKEFIGMFTAYLFSGDDFVLAVKFDDFFSYLFSQFSHLIYSVDAGVKSFSESGPTLPKDILVSAIGVFPSSLYSFFGLESLGNSA